MAAFSIPASEHSTITMWGREREVDAYRNMVDRFAAPGKTFACVSDSYDVFNVVENIWGDELRDRIKDSGGTLVIRPDSGVPVEIVLKCLEILERKVGMARNTKGFKVLPKYLRIIQGDGVNQQSIREILTAMMAQGYSASNLAFGMGGALLQQLNRDTQKFAFKCSEATVAGKSVRVWKDPVTDNGKRSKAGRMSLVREGGELKTVEGVRKDDLLVPVFEEVRATSMKGLA
jgi:nicotinamide phosphoribosyltransferase